MQKAKKNAVGKQLRAIRSKLKMSQAQFASKCQRRGWTVTREIIARIETHTRCVSDFELILLSEVLKLPAAALLPARGTWRTYRREFLKTKPKTQAR